MSGSSNNDRDYDPKSMTERCERLHHRYFELLSRTKNMVGFEKIVQFDEIVAELEAMSTEIAYICRL